MQLLHSRSTPSPEFVSLSLLFKGDIAGEEIAFRIIEPLLLPSTVATISQVTCVEALTELHQYINAVVRASRSRKDKQTSKLASVLLQEDEKLLNDIQVFRPLKGNGIGLHYRVIRHRSTISNLVPLIFDASRATASANKGTESEVTGVVLCLGMAGLPSSVVMSPLHYSISQRMRDCVNILNRVGSKDVEASKDLLATLLLTEDEDRITNTMAEGFRSNFLSADDLVARTKIKSRGRTSTTKKNKRATPLEPDDEFGFSKTSADQARMMVERLAVLSVAETDTILRKFEMKDDKVMKKRRTAADLDGFDFRGERISSSRDSVSGATGIRSSANIYKQDIRADSGARQRIAALSAPGRDTNPKHSGRHSLDPFVGNVSRDTMAVGETSVDSGGNFREYESGNPRFQVNLALNEDLTCFYKQSRMSSCSVEGLIQVQVKSNTKPGFPFYLFIRDPSGHIQSIQENRKFAEIVDAAGEPDIDYLFAVSVPQPDNYFPVMRYKCDSELRPVPIVSVDLILPCTRLCFNLFLTPYNDLTSKESPK